MGCLISHADVLALRVYEYMVGASRLGAAIDKLVTAYIEKNGDGVTTPSVVRRYFLELDIHLRGESAVSFTVTPSCLFVVGGTVVSGRCRMHLPHELTTALPTPAIEPAWCGLLTFEMLRSPDGTLAVFSELELLWWPRFFPSQRDATGGFLRYANHLLNLLTTQETTILGQLNDHHMAVQQATLTVTLLPTVPTVPQLVTFVKGNAQATMAMHRTLVRAASTTGALSLDLYVVPRCRVTFPKSPGLAMLVEG